MRIIRTRAQQCRRKVGWTFGTAIHGIPSDPRATFWTASRCFHTKTQRDVRQHQQRSTDNPKCSVPPLGNRRCRFRKSPSSSSSRSFIGHRVGWKDEALRETAKQHPPDPLLYRLRPGNQRPATACARRKRQPKCQKVHPGDRWQGVHRTIEPRKSNDPFERSQSATRHRRSRRIRTRHFFVRDPRQRKRNTSFDVDTQEGNLPSGPLNRLQRGNNVKPQRAVQSKSDSCSLPEQGDVAASSTGLRHGCFQTIRAAGETLNPTCIRPSMRPNRCSPSTLRKG